MKRIFSILMLAIVAGTAHGQGTATPAAKEPLPPGPIIVQPETADWQMVVTEQPEPIASKGGAPATGAAKVTTSRVTKSGKIYRKVTAAPGGAITTRWARGSLEFVIRADEPHPTMISRAGISSDYIDFSQTAFPELSWVTRENYVGVEPKGGVKCYVFKAHVSTPLENSPGKVNGMPGPDATDHTAYINVDTHLPVEMEYTRVVYLYGFSATPPPELALPPEFNRLMKEKKNEEDQLARRPASS